MNLQKSRRTFLKTSTWLGVSLTSFGTLLQRCGQPAESDTRPKPDNTVVSDPCRDYTGLTEDDVKARQKLGYVEVSPINDRQCGNCNLWLPPPAGAPCGKCQLFKGPVETGGHCTYWVPMEKQPG